MQPGLWRLVGLAAGLLCAGLAGPAVAQPTGQPTAPTSPSPTARRVLLVAEVVISGNRRTKEFIIRRELDLAAGDTVAPATLPARLAANAQRVFNTQLFATAEVTADSSQGPGLRVLVQVKENWYVWAAPYARLNDRNLNEWAERGSQLRRLNVGLFLDHDNLLGRLQKLELIAETGFSDRYTLRYNVPYLDRRQRYGLLSAVSYQSLTNLAYTTRANRLEFAYRDAALQTQWEGYLKLRRRQGFYVFHYAELGYRQVQASAGLRELNPFYLSEASLSTQRLASLGYTFRYDRRDNVNYPLRGRALVVDVRRLGVLPTDNFRSWQGRLAFGDYYPLGGRWYANYLLKGTAYSNPDLPYYLLGGIGYDETVLRGYDLYVVNGSAYGTARLNLKRELLRRILPLRFVRWRQFNTLPLHLYLCAFADGGYVHNRYPARLDNPLANRALGSTGLGLEVNTWYNAVLRLNLSYNALGETNFFLNLQKDLWTRWN